MANAIQAATTQLPTSPPGPSDELQRYRRGEITELEYLQGRIEYATSHLKGRISAERLEMIKEVVTEKLQTDPVLLEARARLRGPANDPK